MKPISPCRLVVGALFCGLAALPAAAADHLVISQIYGGGGSGAPVAYKRDYVELFNPTSQPVSLAGWSIQYASASGANWQVHALPATLSIAPGQYLLIGESSGTAGDELPLAPDASGSLALSATDAKVALVNGTAALSGCPASGFVDLVGYGSANCFETAATPVLNKQSGIVRKSNGCTDSDNNAADFDLVSHPMPRNGASPTQACTSAPPTGRMSITEFMYQGGDGEFVEFTNVGNAPVDMAGWSYADSSRNAGNVPLGAFGLVQPGQSVILAEAPAAAFRSAWGLCARAKVIGGNSIDNLGRSDEINLYDASQTLVDRLVYGDNVAAVGGPRTQNVSAWPSATALGQNRITGWALSAPGNAEGARLSGAGDIGSPGRSQHAPVAYDPCVVDPNAPKLSIDPLATSIHLDLAPDTEGSASGVIDDPTDPAATAGIGLVLGAPDGDAAALSVSVESSNEAVVDAAGLLLSGSGVTRTLRVVPHGVGHSQLTIRVIDAQQREGQYIIRYAASAAASAPATTHFLTGASDASASVSLDAQHMLVADDETNRLRLYRRDRSGLPLAGFDFVPQLGLTDPANPEMDLEGAARLGDRVFWTGSFSNSKNNHVRPNRQRVFATDLAGEGADTTLTYAGRYDWLLQDLVAWDHANGHGLGADHLGLGASSAEGADSKTPAGLNIEGLAFAPDDSTAYLAFRAPQLPTNARHHALIIPVSGFDALVSDGAAASLPAGSARFGAPILLDLGGRGIRSLDRNARGQYLITAGAAGEAGPAPDDFRLFAWTGQPGDAPIALDVDLAALGIGNGSFESIAGLPDLLGRGSVLQFLLDNGDTAWYGDGIAAKDLPDPRLKKAAALIATVDVAFPAADLASAGGTPQTATVDTAFALPLAVRVRDVYGTPVTGASIRFDSDTPGAGATLSAATASTDADGFARVSATANAVAGRYRVTARMAGVVESAVFELDNLAGPAAVISATSGSPQQTAVGSAFALPLRACIADAQGNPIAQASVAFAAPGSGASATVASAIVQTGSDGCAETLASANTIAGRFHVTARVAGVAEAAAFELDNLAGPAATISILDGSPQHAIVGTAFAQPLRVRVVDSHGNAVGGAEVRFVAPLAGASATLAPTAAITGTDGRAETTATANDAVGTYAVAATLPDNPVTPARFDLSNRVDVDADRIFRDDFEQTR